MCSGAIMFAPEHLKHFLKVCRIISESKRSKTLVAGQKVQTNTFKKKILNCRLFMFHMHLMCT